MTFVTHENPAAQSNQGRFRTNIIVQSSKHFAPSYTVKSKLSQQALNTISLQGAKVPCIYSHRIGFIYT
jgi:hypothetical protein